MRFQFIVGEIFSGLRRNMSMVISVVLVTFISLLFVGVASLLQMQINTMKGYWYDKVEVTIFLCSDFSRSVNCYDGAASDNQIEAIRKKLNSDPLVSPYIEDFFFESQQQAYENFKTQFPNSPILESLTVDQLPESFRVKLVDPTKYEIVSDSFSNVPGVDTVNDQRKVLEQLFSIINGFSVVAVAVAGVIIVSAILLITTTIRLSAFSRRKEIGIMRLVGASKTFIQLPFVLEGVISATIGAILAAVCLWLGVTFFIDGYLAVTYTQTSFISSVDMFSVAPALLIIGIVLSGLSSIFALRRYLKV